MPAGFDPILVIIAVLCLTIGYVFGWLISAFQHNRETKQQPAADMTVDQPIAETAAAPTVQGFVPPEVVEAPPAGLSALLSVWEGGQNAGLVVKAGKKTFTDVGALTLDDRKSIEAGLRATANWMGLSYQLGEPSPAPITPGLVQPVVTSAAPLVSEVVEGGRPAAVLNDMTNALADVLQPVAKKDTVLSIVEQIDEVLQSLVNGTPFEDKKILLIEDPRKGVLVRVGSDVYEGVGALPEGEIKQLVRSAVAEWEKRQEKLSRRQTSQIG
jgi:hypothetical protein